MSHVVINYFQNGHLVTLKESFLGEPVGTLCFVYDTYSCGRDHPGVSLITANGVDLGGFSLEEQAEYLEYWCDAGVTYSFTNVVQLHADYVKGLFTPLFQLPRYIRRSIAYRAVSASLGAGALIKERVRQRVTLIRRLGALIGMQSARQRYYGIASAAVVHDGDTHEYIVDRLAEAVLDACGLNPPPAV